MTPEELAAFPGQPDGIEDGSYDMPDPARGDGVCAAAGGQPLYARDLEAVVREVKRLSAELGKLNNAINWDTTCHGCAAEREASYAEHCRAEKVQGTLDRRTAERDAAIAQSAELKASVEAWEKTGETISRHIPEHYEAGEGSFDSILIEWAAHADAVISAAHAWRKRGRTTEDGNKLDAAVEKIYPTDEYL